MLVALFPILSLVTVIHAQLCQPDSKNAFKVRLSLKTALGDKAMSVIQRQLENSSRPLHPSPQRIYSVTRETKITLNESDQFWINLFGIYHKGIVVQITGSPVCTKYDWNGNEEYLFKAMVAFSLRTFSNRETIEISNVLVCNVTKRVSFWFVVTDPSKNQTLPAGEVQAAIRMNRNRINNAFLLNDQTLEFLEVPATLRPPTQPSTPIWIIIFGVVFCLVIVGIVLLIMSGIHQRRRKNKASTETGDVEDKYETMVTIENGIPCDTLDSKEGRINRAFASDDEKFTPL